jgi:hypothetical protein
MFMAGTTFHSNPAKGRSSVKEARRIAWHPTEQGWKPKLTGFF